MKKIFLLLGLFLPSLLFAQLGKDYKFTEYTLPNGLTVLLHQDHSAPNVIVGVRYHIGSKNEAPGQTGLAHFIEHVQFHGTKNIPQGQLEKIIMNAGGYCNAYTHYDETYFYQLLPSHQYKLGLWVESERMLHPVVEKKSLEKERGIVLQEKNMRYHKGPLSNSFNEMQEAMYPYETYGHSMIGTEKDIKAATVKDFQDFRKKYYAPVNACLVVVGNIDIEETKKWVAHYFADIPRGEKVIQPKNYKRKSNKNVVLDKYPKNLKKTSVYICYDVCPETHKDARAVQLLSAYMYNDDKECTMEKDIKDRDTSIYGVSGTHELWENVGLFKLQIRFKNDGDAMKLVNKIQSEIDKIKKSVDKDRFLRAKNAYEYQLPDIYFDNESAADMLGHFHCVFGSAAKFKDYFDSYKRVTAADLERVAKKYLNVNNRTVIIYHKDKETK